MRWGTFVVVAALACGCSLDGSGRRSGSLDASDDVASEGCLAACTRTAPVPAFLDGEDRVLLYAAGTKPLVVGNGISATLDTDTGQILFGATVVRPAGEGLDATSGVVFTIVDQADGAPKLGVFSLASLTLEANSATVAVGESALAILSKGAISVLGTLDVGATEAEGGPGGRDGVTAFTNAGHALDGNALRVAEDEAASEPGGSGGSNGGGGGGGGPGYTAAVATPGPAAGTGVSADTWEALVGGGGGGPAYGTTNGTFAQQVTTGGGGGGAVLLASATELTVGETGIVAAPGEGGRARSSAVYLGAGSGGGAGGSIVLEAPTVTILGAVTANGGGGQGADAHENGTTEAGTRGSLSTTTPATGSAAADSAAGVDPAPKAGGVGGAGEELDGGGGKGGTPGTPGSGGGGGVGRIAIRTIDVQVTIDPTAVLSPAGGAPLKTDGVMLTDVVTIP